MAKVVKRFIEVCPHTQEDLSCPLTPRRKCKDKRSFRNTQSGESDLAGSKLETCISPRLSRCLLEVGNLCYFTSGKLQLPPPVIMEVEYYSKTAVSPLQQNYRSTVDAGKQQPSLTAQFVLASPAHHHFRPRRSSSRRRGIGTDTQPHQSESGKPGKSPFHLKTSFYHVYQNHKNDTMAVDSRRICGGCGGTCIPQREYKRPRADPLSQHELREVILFSVNGKCGYPLVDALRKQYTGLDGRDDKMSFGCKSAISLRLEVCPSLPAQFNRGLISCLQWLPYRKWAKNVGADSLISLRER